MTHFKCHREVDELGRGKCGVPMWCGGLPAGFCDAGAYGEQEPGQKRYGTYERGHFYSGYSGGGLCCYDHGGPNVRVFRDGTAFCAVKPDFTDLQNSPAGFGDTPEQAKAALITEDKPQVGGS